MRRIAPRRNVWRRLLGDAREPDSVALLYDQIGQGGDHAARAVELADPAGAGESHRGAAIDNEIRPQVCVRLEFLHVEAVRARIHAPVEQSNIVAGHILPIFGELHTRPAMRALVMARHRAGHWQTRRELGAPQPRHRRGIDHRGSARRGHRVHPPSKAALRHARNRRRHGCTNGESAAPRRRRVRLRALCLGIVRRTATVGPPDATAARLS